MSVTQPPPSSVCVRRSRIPLQTSTTTFLRRREQRDASALLPCRGLLGFACRFRRFSSSAPFCFSSCVAARRLFDIVVIVIINAKLSAFLAFAEPTRSLRRRSVSIFRRFDAFSFLKSVETLTLPRVSAVDAPFCSERRFVRKRRGAVVLGTDAPSNLGETPT